MSKILAIDDNTDNLRLVKETIKKYIPDCVVLVAESGLEGIHSAKSELPDTILLDIMMPEMDGYEVCEILKKDQTTCHIPIILFSGYVKDPAGIIRGLEAGADVFLEKPIDPAELAAQIKVMLRIKKAEDNLKKEVQKYRVMTETLQDAIISIKLDEEIAYISPVAIELFKLDRELKYLNKNAYQFIFSEKSTALRQLLNEVLVLGRVKDIEMLLSKGDGSEFYAEVSASLINDELNNPLEFILVIKDISNRKQTEIEILNYQHNLKLLNSELSLIEEKERKRIASYLHDGIGQTLSLARINLTSINKHTPSTKVNEIVESCSELINSAIAKTRSLTFDLSPPILFELGLIPALKWKLNQIEEEHNVKTFFKFDNNFPVIKDAIRILLYRIISELISNAIKHAKPNKIEITCRINNDTLSISVNDDGTGFDYKPKPNMIRQYGFGLFSIKERLDYMAGSLEISSKIKKGTTATIIIPLKNL
ncbi:MAG: response regulator [Bacteroidetes bacterium]|nr:response regulator [Bacteroidota bacterium]